MTVPQQDPQFISAADDELLVERLEPRPAAARDFDGDQQDRQDRLSLRRVSGMSTELADIAEVEYRQLLLERVVLVSVWTTGSEVSAGNAIAELKLLAETAGSQVLEGLMQRRDRPDPATYIGRGKVAELRDVVVATGADTVICDGELTPAQLRNLEDRIGVKVIDRTALILDIFAAHAKSAEGKAQVELALLRYRLPRLRRGSQARLSQQRGGVGARFGGGETKLETDRRRIRQRIRAVKREIERVRRNRHTRREARLRSATPVVTLSSRIATPRASATTGFT